jgi:hypothetical protein
VRYGGGILGDVPLTRLFAVGLWLLATVGSTAVVWTATSVVAADVTDRPARVLAHDDVVSEVESGAQGTTTSSTVSTLPATVPATSAVPGGGQGQNPANPSRPPLSPALPRGPQPDAPGTPVPPPAPDAATGGGTGPAAPDPSAQPRRSSPPAPEPRPTATYSTPGGAVRVACDGIFIELISAIPASGYEADVVSGGPGNVDVRFAGPDQEEESVKAVCFGQPIRYYDQDPPRRQAPGPER